MIKLLATILGLSILGSGAAGVPVQQADIQNKNEIYIQRQTENLTNIQWHNNLCSLSNDEKSLNLFEKYSVDNDEAQQSLDVYIQEEYIPFEEIIPVNYVNANSDISLMNLGDSQEQEFIHNEGYIKFVTKAYALGFYDGKIVYHVESSAEQIKTFIINKEENFIIRHGDNAVTLNHQDYPVKGVLYEYETKELNPNYSCAEGGVYYPFTVYDPPVGKNIRVAGDYYMVATDTTAVQPVYVHNQDLFISSLSISFGPIGAGVNTNGKDDIMEGSIMNLKGYSNRITQNVYTMQPADWGFEGRYYFENEGLKYTTKTFEDDFTISTERLRCGYIEEEYINLSPNRYNAGDAYLELKFNKPIYELDTYLSFWDLGESMSTVFHDYAYLQYLDKDGNWITRIDLMTAGLPSDRTAPKHFECDFIEGTYGVRFIAHKQTPNTNRNKGRICIGETKFITCDVD